MESMGLNPAFWSGKRVFVTGHTGFKGGWLALFLHHLGARVTGFALDPLPGPNFFDQAEVSASLAADHRGDLADFEELSRAIKDAAPEIVFHLAAQALVRESYRAPLATFATNIMGTANLLETLRGRTCVQAVVVVTSDKCYRNDGKTFSFAETDPLGGDDPYSASKAGAEIVAQAYRASFPPQGSLPALPPTVTARAGNVIGGGDWSADRLVPDCVRAFSAGAPVVLRHPDAVRPWQHVLEPVYGYLLLAEHLAEKTDLAAAWNFGPDAESHASVGMVAETLARRFGGKVTTHPDSSGMKEAKVLRLDSTRAHDLGWKPAWPLEKALGETARWYQTAQTQNTMRGFTLAQIADFCAASARMA